MATSGGSRKIHLVALGTPARADRLHVAAISHVRHARVVFRTEPGWDIGVGPVGYFVSRGSAGLVGVAATHICSRRRLLRELLREMVFVIEFQNGWIERFSVLLKLLSEGGMVRH